MRNRILFFGFVLFTAFQSIYADDLYHRKGELKDFVTVSQQEAQYILSNYNLLSSVAGNTNNLSSNTLKDIGCVSAYTDSQMIWTIWNRCPKPIKFTAEFRQGFYTVNFDDKLGPNVKATTGLNYTWELVFLHDSYDQ